MLTKRVREIDRYDEKYEDIKVPRSYVSTERHKQVTAERLSEIFCIGLERAWATLRSNKSAWNKICNIAYF